MSGSKGDCSQYPCSKKAVDYTLTQTPNPTKFQPNHLNPCRQKVIVITQNMCSTVGNLGTGIMKQEHPQLNCICWSRGILIQSCSVSERCLEKPKETRAHKFSVLNRYPLLEKSGGLYPHPNTHSDKFQPNNLNPCREKLSLIIRNMYDMIGTLGTGLIHEGDPQLNWICWSGRISIQDRSISKRFLGNHQKNQYPSTTP